MKKNYLLVIGAAMLLAIGMSSCSSSDEEIFNGNNSNEKESSNETKETHKGLRGEVNVLKIQWDNGNKETCLLNGSQCGPHLIFSAPIENSSFVTRLHIRIDSSRETETSNLIIGDTFDNSEIRFEIIDDRPVNGFISLRTEPDFALSGQIEVADIKISDSGKKILL